MKKIKAPRMKILVLNCGSSSVKYQVINGSTRQWLVRGTISRIGANDAEVWQQRNKGGHVKFNKEIKDHEQAMKQILDSLLSKATGILKDISEIFAVGHRIVHGGEAFSQPTLITDEVLEKINEYCYYEKYGIRRYGFHGTSHSYVAQRASELEDRPIQDLKIITCHLGNGCSMAAVKNGKCQDTSMGFTPLEGLLMGTRAGDIDCSAVLYLMRQENLSTDQIDLILNSESGLKGLSGTSNDMRKILEQASTGNEQSQLAFDIFCYRIKKYIGAYAAAMGGLDALVFTAGIGENSSSVRAKVCEGLEFFGVEIDHYENNQAIGEEKKISKEKSRVKVWIIPTNEELVIADHTLNVVYSDR